MSDCVDLLSSIHEGAVTKGSLSWLLGNLVPSLGVDGVLITLPSVMMGSSVFYSQGSMKPVCVVCLVYNGQNDPPTGLILASVCT